MCLGERGGVEEGVWSREGDNWLADISKMVSINVSDLAL